MQKERPGLPGRRCCVGPDSGSDRSVRRRWPYRPVAITRRGTPPLLSSVELGRARSASGSESERLPAGRTIGATALGGALALVVGMVPFVGGAGALVVGMVPFVGGAGALVVGMVPFVGGVVSFVGREVTF